MHDLVPRTNVYVRSTWSNWPGETTKSHSPTCTCFSALLYRNKDYITKDPKESPD